MYVQAYITTCHFGTDFSSCLLRLLLQTMSALTLYTIKLTPSSLSISPEAKLQGSPHIASGPYSRFQEPRADSVLLTLALRKQFRYNRSAKNQMQPQLKVILDVGLFRGGTLHLVDATLE